MIELLELMERTAGTRRRCCSRARAAPARNSSRARSTRNRRAAARPFVAVNCARDPRTAARERALRTREGRLHRRRPRAPRACSRRPTAARCSSTRSASCRLALQAKLLRVLQEGEIRPVGDSKTRQVDVRVIAATEPRPRGEVAEGRFREDLFYRLNVMQLAVPPLRERPQDIPLLVDHFLAHFRDTLGKPRARDLRRSAANGSSRYRWPGNVRELENVIERAVILADARPHRRSPSCPRTSSRRCRRRRRGRAPRISRSPRAAGRRGRS